MSQGRDRNQRLSLRKFVQSVPGCFWRTLRCQCCCQVVPFARAHLHTPGIALPVRHAGVAASAV
eukprot:174973-Pyramimonas_sp.AAC.1